MSLRPAVAAFLLLAIAPAACDNAGADRVLTFQATGVVNGFVYLDSNGNGQFDLGEAGMANVAVALVSRGTRDTVARVQTGAQGLVRFASVPVGHYTVAIDTAVFGDSIAVTAIDSAGLQILPEDSAVVIVTVSFPRVTIAQARTLPPGRKVFVRGLVLTSASPVASTFGDTLLHLRDSTAAIRVVVATGSLFRGDTATFRGTLAARGGQPILGKADLVGLTCIPPACPYPGPPSDTVLNAAARTAGGPPLFRLDAALIRVVGDTIVDTARVATGPDLGNLLVRVFDGSDTLVVHFDTTFAFPGVTLPAGLVPGAILDATGVLVPTGAGAWHLKPRSPTDVTIR